VATFVYNRLIYRGTSATTQAVSLGVQCWLVLESKQTVFDEQGTGVGLGTVGLLLFYVVYWTPVGDIKWKVL